MIEMKKNKLISIVTPCFNEEDNIAELYIRISCVMKELAYDYEHICIDNCSTDGTVSKLRAIAEKDSRLKIIVNSRNFGHIRSPYYGVLQAKGDAVVLISSDLQDPPENIEKFIRKWEEGFKIVLATKPISKESSIMFFIRKLYYKSLSLISEVPLIDNATGAGLYDRKVVEVLRELDDPYPYFRGLLCEIGFPIATVPFVQPKRLYGISKVNFYALFDIALLGITNHSKVPLRMLTLLGFSLSLVFFLIAMFFLVAKLMYWDRFQLGMAPIIIGMFFISAVQLFFMGFIGEYIGSIHTKIRKLPLVVEKERINFKD